MDIYISDVISSKTPDFLDLLNKHSVVVIISGRQYSVYTKNKKLSEMLHKKKKWSVDACGDVINLTPCEAFHFAMDDLAKVFKWC